MSNLLIQPAFSAGEIGPELYGRVDNQLYYAGLRTCENFFVQQYGGLRNRHGLEFIAPTRYPAKHCVAISFQYSTTQTYVLEVGDGYTRFYRDGGQVLEANKAITAVTNANPAVVTSAAHAYANGDDVFIMGIAGMTELNGRWFRIKNVTTNTFELTDYYGTNINSTGYGTYTSGGTVARVYTITTPWLEADLDSLSWVQSADVLTICHPSYYPRDLSRTGHTSWTLSNFANTEGPFKDINVDSTVTVYASAATGTGVTVTASSALFNANMVGELFYIEQTPDDTTARWETAKTVAASNTRRAGNFYYFTTAGGTTGTYRPDWVEGTGRDGDTGVLWQYLHSGFGIVRITGYTSATVVTVDVVSRLPDRVVGAGNPTYNWAKVAWSVAEGYPSTAIYHQSRMIFGGTTGQPQTMWFSGSAARTFFGRSKPILDNDGLSITLDSLEVNDIRHFLPLSSLIALTGSSEVLITGQSGKTILATETPLTQVQGYNGASRVRPIVVNNTALFVQEGSSVTRSLVYSFDSDTYTGINLMARSPHIFEKSNLRRWSYAKVPYSVIWSVRYDGILAGLTYLKEQEVYAWHRHVTDGEFTSLATIRENSEDSTYLIVKRTINGQTVRYMERMRSRRPLDVRDAYYVDSGLSFDGRNTTATTMTLTGGTNWNEYETLTLTASASVFSASMIGDAIVWRNEDGVAYRLEITAFTNATTVSVSPNRQVEVAYRNVARADWEHASMSFGGLWHLEGKTVSLLVDGNVHPSDVVTNGRVSLQYHGCVVHIGLPYTARMATLDITTPQQSLRGQTFNVPRVYIAVESTRGLWVGEDGGEMYEYKQRDESDGYDKPLDLLTETIEQNIDSSWNNRGRITIEQRDPLPAHILSVIPEVVVSRQGTGG